MTSCRRLLVLVLGASGACSSPIVGTDAGAPPTDAPAIDAPPTDAPAAPDTPGPVVPDVTHEGGGPAAYACLGMRFRPAPGAAVTVPVHVSDLSNGAPGGAHTLHVFEDEAAPPATCDAAAPCVSFGTVAGNGSVMVPAGGFGTVRLLAGAIAVDTIANHARAPLTAAQTWQLGYFSAEARDIALGALGRDAAPGAAALSGTVIDCAGLGVGEVTIRIFRADGTEIAAGPARTDPVVGYFPPAALTPTTALPRTSDDGRWAAANVPVATDERVRVEAWGNIGGTPTLLSCETAAAMPGGIGLVELGPLRNDYPAGTACAP